MPSGSNAERPLQASRWQEHGAAQAGGPRTQQAGKLETRALFAGSQGGPSTTYWTTATGINASGHIVGDYSGPSRGSGFLYINGFYGTIDYPSASAVQTIGMGINGRGQVVGWYVEKGSNFLRGFLLSGGTYANIDYPSANQTIPWGINDNGQIVGSYGNSSGAGGFLYDSNSGNYTTLNLPWPIGLAGGINNNGQIVGGYQDGSGGHGFLYDPNSGPYLTLDFP